MYRTCPALILSRIRFSDWYGSRKLTMPASANKPSISELMDAPVYTLI